ncbi:MAG TPA: dienelactone hydrolase family protein [Rhodocyclaceae bacterium]|nr:dienelactone hydrolase family protein [Rhodocyclaceae bacterium]HMZ82737.1 dienelactone hydrolase family protein [Rhodocyclaceae bacterium]HNB77418.1 dienelactone hydrolase family protein [Rhodocyclaceae bacterium]HNC60945.1 dienelactone hydrolase family protein [Rhodocyclaceae bacterium]HNH11934.1 dienelactone hydrolase family protein [Rhodocyclaceae bacterium]
MKTIATPDHDLHFDSLAPAVPFSRRDFVATVVGAGFALAVQPVAAQQIITTDSAGLSAGAIRIASENGEIAAYRSMPVGGKSLPVVLVISEIFGVHEHIADLTRRLAKLGYLAVAPELFARQGDPRKLTNIQQIISEIVAKVPDAQVAADLDATLAWAVANGGDASRVAVTGFCWGGRQTWMYCARNPKVKAGAAWYGRIEDTVTLNQPRHPIDIAAELKVPVLGLYGGKDQGIPLDNVEDMKQALATAGGKSQIHVYPDAPHAFHADYRPSYRKAEAEDGWRRMLDWFRANGV